MRSALRDAGVHRESSHAEWCRYLAGRGILADSHVACMTRTQCHSPDLREHLVRQGKVGRYEHRPRVKL